MRILGLDIGEKRIGVAVSDGLGSTAQGIAVIERRTLQSDLGRLKKLIAEYAVKEIVVGIPLRLNGSVGKEAAGVISFAGKLEKELNLPIKHWDERLTTVSAERVLIQGRMRRGRRRKVIDKLASQIILQSYLDARKAPKNSGA